MCMCVCQLYLCGRGVRQCCALGLLQRNVIHSLFYDFYQAERAGSLCAGGSMPAAAIYPIQVSFLQQGIQPPAFIKATICMFYVRFLSPDGVGSLQHCSKYNKDGACRLQLTLST